jgi:hypothetical protein
LASHLRFNRIQRRLNPFPRICPSGRQKRGNTVLREKLRHRTQGVGRGVHRFTARAAVNVQIDKAGEQDTPRGINDFGGDTVGRITATERRDLAVARQQPTTLDSGGGCYQLGVSK